MQTDVIVLVYIFRLLEPPKGLFQNSLDACSAARFLASTNISTAIYVGWDETNSPLSAHALLEHFDAMQSELTDAVAAGADTSPCYYDRP